MPSDAMQLAGAAIPAGPSLAAATFFGCAALLQYCATVALGGRLQRSIQYSHLAHAVSELTVAGAPHKRLLDALFIFSTHWSSGSVWLCCASPWVGRLHPQSD